MWNFVLGVLSNWVADSIGAALIGGGVIAWIRTRRPQWIPSIRLGAGAAVAILIAAAALRVVAIPAAPPPVTADTAEDNVRKWSDAFHFGIRRLPDDNTRYFGYTLTNAWGRSMDVVRTRDHPYYLTVLASVTVGPDYLQKVGHLSPNDADLFIRGLHIELARSKVGYWNVALPLTTAIQLDRLMHINNELTEASFLDAMNAMDDSVVLMIEAIPYELDEITCANLGH